MAEKSNKQGRASQELSDTLSSSEKDQFNKNSSTQLFQREKVEGTPFHIIGNKKDGYALVLGDYRLTDMVKNPTTNLQKIAQAIIKKEWWNLIANMIATFQDARERLKIPETLPDQSNEK